MEDKSLFNDEQPRTISEGLQNFIDSMVEEIVLEGRAFDTQKKYLRKFSENEGLDYETIEKGITELIETLEEMKTSDSKTHLKLALFQARVCHVTEALVIRLAEQVKTILEVAEDVVLFPAKQNGLYGYIDVEGNMVIEPQFEGEIFYFNEGLAPVMHGDKWGYIGTSGKMVITPHFDFARSFKDGVAVVGDDDGVFLINRKGEEIVKGDRYNYLGYFHEGFCRCDIGDRCGFINKSGEVVIKPQFDLVGDFHEGMAKVNVGKYDGFVNKNGVLVIKPQYELVKDFNDGLATVRKNGKWGLIDKTGKTLIQPKYEGYLDYSEGLKAERKEIKVRVGILRTEVQSKYGFVDKTENVVIDYRFDDARWFSEGLAAVAVGRKWGYIDKSGRMVIDAQFDDAETFLDGLAKVQVNGKWGLIDKTGEIVIPPKYKYCDWYLINNLLCYVKWDDGTEGYVNRSGKVVFRGQ